MNSLSAEAKQQPWRIEGRTSGLIKRPGFKAWSDQYKPSPCRPLAVSAHLEAGTESHVAEGNVVLQPCLQPFLSSLMTEDLSVRSCLAGPCIAHAWNITMIVLMRGPCQDQHTAHD